MAVRAIKSDEDFQRVRERYGLLTRAALIGAVTVRAVAFTPSATQRLQRSELTLKYTVSDVYSRIEKPLAAA
jgi:hypothetical protein